MMKRVQDQAKLLLKTTDYMDMIQAGKPQWLDADIWEGLSREHWTLKESQKAAKTNKSNRLKPKDEDIIRHTRGSVYTKIHEKRLVNFTSFFVCKSELKQLVFV